MAEYTRSPHWSGAALHFNLPTFLAALLTLGAITTAQATQKLMFVGCPYWRAPLGAAGGSPEDAAASDFAAAGIPQACKPIGPPTCSTSGTDYTHYSCQGYGQQVQTCTPQPYVYSTGTSGTGYPVIDNVITMATNPADEATHCAYWVDEGNGPDNNGGPDRPCPTCAGNPVNVGNGNKFQREADFEAAPSDGSLSFVRYYNSAPPGLNMGVGLGWMHTWARRLNRMGAQVDAYRSDGKVLRFTQSGAIWLPGPDFYDRLTKTTNGWTYVTKDDETESYDDAGRLLSVTSRSGKTTALAYSDGTAGPNGGLIDGTTTPLPAGIMIRVSDFKGRTLSFSYGKSSTQGTIQSLVIVRMTDSAGGTYTYGYDGLANLTTVQYPDGNSRTYVYNESANTSGVTRSYALTGITDEKGARFATFKYLANGQAQSTEHFGGVYKYSFTYSSGSTTYVDPLGSTVVAPVSIIDGISQVTGTTQNCPGCGGTATQTYTFDANRNIASYKDFNGNLTCYSYDLTRNLESSRTEGLSGSGTCASPVTTDATRVITTNWHATWRIPVKVAEPLRMTTFAYNGDAGVVPCAPAGASTALVCSKTVQATMDATGSTGFAATLDGAAHIWSYTYDVNGQLLTVDGPRTDVSDITTYAYYTSDDPAGNYRKGDLKSVKDALQHETQFTQYDGNGRLLKSIDPNGSETVMEYWPRGWIKSRKVGTVADGSELTSFDYDNNGSLTKVTAPDGSFISYEYDDAHRLTDIRDDLANHIHYTLDGMGNRTAEQAFDPNNALARQHSRVIDALNRLAKDIGGTAPATQVTQYTYDNNGNVKTITDPLSRVTTNTYDARNRLREVQDPLNGAAATTKYDYNGQDQLKQVTDPTLLVTLYTLNGYGETTSTTSPDTGTATQTFDPASNLKTRLDARGITATYSYDALNRIAQISYPDELVQYAYDSCANGVGRLCSISDKTGTTSYAYDIKGRVISKTQVVGARSQSMLYGYNAAGQLTSVTTPSGQVVEYGYSGNRPVSVKLNGATVLDTVKYAPFGPVIGWRWGNDTTAAPNVHTRQLDQDFRVKEVSSTLPVAGTHPVFDLVIGWDEQSRVSTLTDASGRVPPATYGYDALDHLTSMGPAQGPSTFSYTYDGIGNRKSATANGATTTYDYFPNTSRLHTLTGAQSASYSFDAAGNTTSSGGPTWTYGGNNRPTAAGATTFDINALGQRVRKTNGGTIIRFVYDEAGRLWGEYDASGNLISETVWLESLPVAVVR